MFVFCLLFSMLFVFGSMLVCLDLGFCHVLVCFPFVGLCLLVFGSSLFVWLHPFPYGGLFGCNHVWEYIFMMFGCTQYSMNMHLRQSPWAHTHTTRLRALITREGHSRSHESPSYKVHNHIYTSRYRYTYIMHNATTQRGKQIKHCQCSKGMAQQGIWNIEQTLPYPRNAAQAKSRKSKRGTWRGTLIHALKKRLKEGDRRI